MEIEILQQKIYEIRGQRVMLDYDLAELYEVETRVLNQAVKRNLDVFPLDFMFQLTLEEWTFMSSQYVMTSSNKRPKSYLPSVFTEHGVAMLSSILKSKKARETSILIVRAFIKLKEVAFHYIEIANQLKLLETQYNKQFDDIFEAINYLMKKENLAKQQIERKKIGFNTKD